MHKSRRIILGIAVILGFISIFGFVVWQPSIIRRVPFQAPEPAYHSWEDILSNPQPITIRTYSTGINQTTLGGIMNLEHEKAQNIADKVIDIPVNVGLVQHQDFGAYLIDAGLDASYVDNPYGTNKGIMVESFFLRMASTGDSSIATVSEACSTSRRSTALPVSRHCATRSFRRSSGPSRMTESSLFLLRAQSAPSIRSSGS